VDPGRTDARVFSLPYDFSLWAKERAQGKRLRRTLEAQSNERKGEVGIFERQSTEDIFYPLLGLKWCRSLGRDTLCRVAEKRGWEKRNRTDLTFGRGRKKGFETHPERGGLLQAGDMGWENHLEKTSETEDDGQGRHPLFASSNFHEGHIRRRLNRGRARWPRERRTEHGKRGKGMEAGSPKFPEKHQRDLEN